MSDIARTLHQVRRVVKTYGVNLPAPVTAALDAKSPVAFPDADATAKAIIADVGNPKKVAAHLADFAALDAAKGAGIHGRVNAALDAAAIRAIRDNKAGVIDAIRKAAAPYLDRLNEAAPNVPGSTPVNDRRIPTSTLILVEAADDAAKALLDLVAGFRALYGGGDLRYALIDVPERLTIRQVQTLAQGIAGARSIETTSGPSTVAAYWWAVSADMGATFRVATPDEGEAVRGRVTTGARAAVPGTDLDAVPAVASGEVMWESSDDA